MSPIFPSIGPQVERAVRRVAREILLPSFRRLMPHQIRQKTIREVVTDIDESVEIFLADELVKIIPGSFVVGEENCHADPDCLAGLNAAEWAWLVDPIDGTNNFIRHADEFGIMVALVNRGLPYAGWIYLPVYDILLCGNHEDGVFRNGKAVGRIHSVPRSFEQLRGLYRLRDRKIEERMQAFPMRHDTHCNAFDYNLLISGDSDFIVYPGSNPWDVVAGGLLIEALGGRAAKIDGKRLEGMEMLTDLPFLATRSRDDWPQVAKALFPELYNS